MTARTMLTETLQLELTRKELALVREAAEETDLGTNLWLRSVILRAADTEIAARRGTPRGTGLCVERPGGFSPEPEFRHE